MDRRDFIERMLVFDDMDASTGYMGVSGEDNINHTVTDFLNKMCKFPKLYRNTSLWACVYGLKSVLLENCLHAIFTNDNRLYVTVSQPPGTQIISNIYFRLGVLSRYDVVNQTCHPSIEDWMQDLKGVYVRFDDSVRKRDYEFMGVKFISMNSLRVSWGDDLIEKTRLISKKVKIDCPGQYMPKYLNLFNHPFTYDPKQRTYISDEDGFSEVFLGVTCDLGKKSYS